MLGYAFSDSAVAAVGVSLNRKSNSFNMPCEYCICKNLPPYIHTIKSLLGKRRQTSQSRNAAIILSELTGGCFLEKSEIKMEKTGCLGIFFFGLPYFSENWP